MRKLQATLLMLFPLSSVSYSQTPCIPRDEAYVAYRLDLPELSSGLLGDSSVSAVTLNIDLTTALTFGAIWIDPDGKKRGLGPNANSIPLGTFIPGKQKIPHAIWLLLRRGEEQQPIIQTSPQLIIRLTHAGALNYHKVKSLRTIKGETHIASSRLALTFVPEELPYCEEVLSEKMGQEETIDCVEYCPETEGPVSYNTLKTEVVAEVKRPKLAKQISSRPYVAPVLAALKPLIPAVQKFRGEVIKTKMCPQDQQTAINEILGMYLTAFPTESKFREMKKMEGPLYDLFGPMAASAAKKSEFYSPSPLTWDRYTNASFLGCGWNFERQKFYPIIHLQAKTDSFITDAGTPGAQFNYREDQKDRGTYTLASSHDKRLESYRKEEGLISDYRFVELAPGILMQWNIGSIGVYGAALLFQE